VKEDRRTNTASGAAAYERGRSLLEEPPADRPTLGDALIDWAARGGDLDALARVAAAVPPPQHGPVSPDEALTAAGRARSAAVSSAVLAQWSGRADAAGLRAVADEAIAADKDLWRRLHASPYDAYWAVWRA
jgi:hypothetical protein